MSTFYRCTNNGTTAVVSEDTYEKIEARYDLADEVKEAQPYPTPIFTFVRERDYDWRYRQFVTGDLALMDKLLNGHLVMSGGLYVPFSNSFELQGGEQAESELRFRTTLAEAVEAFGLKVPEMIIS